MYPGIMRSLCRTQLPSRALAATQNFTTPPSFAQLSTESQQDPYWKRLRPWKDVEAKEFLSYEWQKSNSIKSSKKLIPFLEKVIPEQIPDTRRQQQCKPMMSREDFLSDVEQGIQAATMSTRLTPHIMAVANWDSPLDDPIVRQFLPLKSSLVPDHPMLTLDSLHEEKDSPMRSLVHRYPDKVLFITTSRCPVYCRFCTRSYGVGEGTDSVKKTWISSSFKDWEEMFAYIEAHPKISDVVVSGGDTYYLSALNLEFIGDRLLDIPHVKRIRFATRGLSVCPMRVLNPNNAWTNALLRVSDHARAMGNGKQVALHTHFNHANEITWATEQAASYLHGRGLIMRNQTVLLRGVNDNVAAMSTLIRTLADMNIQPYYVYQADMVQGTEDLRTPLSTILELQKQIRGTIAGFMTPQFIVDMPGGGGKRLACDYETYDKTTGVSTFRAPGVKCDRVFEYHDPVDSNARS